MHPPPQQRIADRQRTVIARWLLGCCALVFVMVVLGGATRLTHSGLSIVEWQPIVGAIPPLTGDDWQALFEKYRRTPEYRKVNPGMTVEGFKEIFWLEYFHRLLGRVIGIAFLAPFLWFLFRRMIDRPLAWQLAGIFLLGAIQGVLGWYMVKSGLVDDPRVSPFRLTAHLLLAFLIYAFMLWIALGLTSRRSTAGGDPRLARVRRAGWVLTALVMLMVVTGGFVAGTRAGLAYNTFPLMNGHFVPPELFMLDPWHDNFFHNPALVQFNHRLTAWVIAFYMPWLWLRMRGLDLPRQARLAADVTLAAVVLQIALGIGTLLLAVPPVLGTLHQGGALAVFTLALALNHALACAAHEGSGSGRDPVA
jgi:cytochrome c oxidase assembly protein subunit 15